MSWPGLLSSVTLVCKGDGLELWWEQGGGWAGRGEGGLLELKTSAIPAAAVSFAS